MITKCKNDSRIMKVIPKQFHSAIFGAWVDDDGYWVMLNHGYKLNSYFSETVIHEDSLSDVAKVAKNIIRV